MQNPLLARIPAAILVLSMAGWPTPTSTQSASPLFTADRDACFGRVYDQAHLRSHPKQRVTSFHVLRWLEPRREAENWTPGARTEAIKSFREDGRSTVTAFVTFRDRKGYFHNMLSCDKEGRDGVRCAVDCDGGSFRVTREGPSSALLHNDGFVLIGGCGDEVEEGQEMRFEPGADDKVFRLDNRPVAACRAEEQKATPIPAGLPLRERFKADEQFCFGRDFDAAHLARNPNQMVAQLRVGRLTPAKEREDDTDSPYWWFNVKLDVSVTLRSTLQTTTTRYACSPLEASWECRRQVEGDTPSSCRDRSIHLVRGPGGDILVQNRNSGLPIDKECEAAETGSQFGDRPRTRSDDRSFRLTRMPIRQCQL